MKYWLHVQGFVYLGCATGTLYKNNSGLIVKMKVSKYKKGLCLTEK